MKIFSFNVRGLGKKAKRREIKEMLKKNNIDFCCIQETKLGSMENRICNSIWGDRNYDWVCKEANGNSGGILSIWNDRVFCKVSAWFADGVLVVNGFLRDEGIHICIMNVYAPCLSFEKMALWDLICNIVAQQSSSYIYVARDFNAIRKEEERMGRGTVIDYRDIMSFNDFISNANLVELPLWGRSYTWYRKDGSCKSKLDRFLVNEEWLNRWPKSYDKKLWSFLLRSLSYLH